MGIAADDGGDAPDDTDKSSVDEEVYEAESRILAAAVGSRRSLLIRRRDSLLYGANHEESASRKHRERRGVLRTFKFFLMEGKL